MYKYVQNRHNRHSVKEGMSIRFHGVTQSVSNRKIDSLSLSLKNKSHLKDGLHPKRRERQTITNAWDAPRMRCLSEKIKDVIRYECGGSKVLR